MLFVKPAEKELRETKLFILDIDGTFSLSGKPFEGSYHFFKVLKYTGKTLVFLTNNSNKKISEYVEEFKHNGIDIYPEQIFTAGVATAEYLLKEFGPKRVYIVGTMQIIEEFERIGHTFDDRDPEIVVITFDLTLTYDKLKKAVNFVRKGKLYVLTNPDLNCPTADGILPDAGAINQVVRKASGKEPDIVFGKPDPKLIDMIVEKFNVKKEQVCVVGDRLYTDILIGIQAGVLTALVLTGEAKLEDIERGVIKPHVVANDIGELAKFLESN